MLGLWITRFAIAQRGHLASDQEILEPLRPSVHIELLQQLQQRRGRQFQRLVALCQALPRQQRQLLAFSRCLEALVDGFDRGRCQRPQQAGPAHVQGLFMRSCLF
ncbi:hypothetical protein D3C80_1374780 [compost metagenome]